MDIENIRSYCLNKEGVEETCPFGPENLVFKINGKIFLILNLTMLPLRITLKCEPEKAQELRESYECVMPGFHMNKKHWNTIIIESYLNSKEIKKWIDDSYGLVRR